jgi:hypothetical protein
VLILAAADGLNGDGDGSPGLELEEPNPRVGIEWLRKKGFISAEQPSCVKARHLLISTRVLKQNISSHNELCQILARSLCDLW